MDVKTIYGGVVSIDTLLTVKDGGVIKENLTEIPNVTDNQTIWVVCDNNIKSKAHYCLIVVNNTLNETCIDFGYNNAKEIYSKMFDCDINNVDCMGTIIQINGEYKITNRKSICYSYC